jgi:hypothetical protein
MTALFGTQRASAATGEMAIRSATALTRWFFMILTFPKWVQIEHQHLWKKGLPSAVLGTGINKGKKLNGMPGSRPQ